MQINPSMKLKLYILWNKDFVQVLYISKEYSGLVVIAYEYARKLISRRTTKEHCKPSCMVLSVLL